jgi:site-specific DNA recombinase
MHSQPTRKNAVGAIRVSSLKQGNQGDSPEDQKEQIERFAASQNINIKKFFIFIESGAGDIQPMQEGIDYCKDSKNEIDFFIIKSIDRFTRGGSDMYSPLKNQLEQYNVSLIDIYGIIGTKKVNTLDHLGVKYKWSEYSPTRKSELLEAERANDEWREILTRVIGAEVRYTRLGYWMRQPPYGFESYRVDTTNGKRCLLRSEPQEAKLILKMFELRQRGTLDDSQIVDEINKLGYKSRVHVVRDKRDRTKVIGHRGGNKLDLKQFWKYIQNPIYAGVICEKWTDDKPLKAKFDGLVSIEEFNAANRGKVVISEKDGEVFIYNKPPEARYATKKGTRNAEFPYRKTVMCPECSQPLFGSASRGKLGKYYPAYHCNKRGHYFRVPKPEFENKIVEFVQQVTFSQAQIDTLMSQIELVWNRRQESVINEEATLEARIETLKSQARATVDKIKLVSSEIAIKHLEEDLVKLEEEIKALEAEQAQKAVNKPTDFKTVLKYVKYFLEHLDYLLLQQIDPVARANFFGVLFDKLPTYKEIVSGTQNLAELTGLNELFKLKNVNNSLMVTPRGVEPLIFRMRT